MTSLSGDQARTAADQPWGSPAAEADATPAVWSDLVGQELVVETLRAAVRSAAAMTHSWLITGPPGSGRSNAARAFAAALECPRGGCGHCHTCRAVAAGTYPDVTVLATDKVVIGIEDVRALVQTAGRSPGEGAWRVIIVEDADRMAERTTNVLLKAIEEPAPRTVWLLCAPSPQDVLLTIRSRCRAVSLRVPPAQAVADLLVRRDGAAPEAALDAAWAAQSHVGRARRLARDPGLRHRRDGVIRAAAGIRGVGDAVLVAAQVVEAAQDEATTLSQERDATERTALLTSLGAQDAGTLPPTIRSQVRQLEDDQKRRARRRQLDVIDQTLLDLLGFFRDVLVVQLAAGADPLNRTLGDEIALSAQSGSPAQTLRRIDAISLARIRLAGNVSPLLAVEAMMVDLRVQA